MVCNLVCKLSAKILEVFEFFAFFVCNLLIRCRHCNQINDCDLFCNIILTSVLQSGEDKDG